MKGSKSLIIGLVLALLVMIGYAVYLHRGPMKRIADENEKRFIALYDEGDYHF